MSTYDKTMFYWLQLKEDFFDEEAISWLEEQPNGKECCLFYLKLCLKSLKTNGIMIRQVNEMLLPYDEKKLAELTKTTLTKVKSFLQTLQQISLIKILENGAIYFQNIEKMIGAKSIGAFKKEQSRFLKGGQTADKCPPTVRQNVRLETKTIEYKSIESFSQSIITARTREAESVIREHFKDYLSYWGYSEEDKAIFEEIVLVLVEAIEKAQAQQLKFYQMNYDINLLAQSIAILDEQDIRDVAFQVLNKDDIQNRFLYILGALLTRANEKQTKILKGDEID